MKYKICTIHNINSTEHPEQFYVVKKKLYLYCKLCISFKRKKSYLKNKERELAVNKQWRINNPEKLRTINSNWKKNNPDKKNKLQRSYRKERRKRDPMFKVMENLRTRMYVVVTSKHAVKESTTMKLTGCTLDFLKKYLEKKFKDGMSWDNYGQWHIDHIKPCASFNLVDPMEQKKCFHYTNLQPLWGEHNLKKGSKLNYEVG